MSSRTYPVLDLGDDRVLAQEMHHPASSSSSSLPSSSDLLSLPNRHQECIRTEKGREREDRREERMFSIPYFPNRKPQQPGKWIMWQRGGTDFFFMTNGMGQTIAPKSASSAERSKKQTVPGRAITWAMTAGCGRVMMVKYKLILSAVPGLIMLQHIVEKMAY